VDSSASTWRTAPKNGVQTIVLFHAHPYRTLVMGQDVYNLPGAPANQSKNGVWVSDEAYTGFMDAADADMNWPGG
jgi:hypothetical protein